MIHSILIIGQSNMAGRGFPDEVEPILNKNLLVLRNGRWQPMFVPVNPDTAFAGISLVESFADMYSKDHDAKVGIIPCAHGGTYIEHWQVGGLLFDHACYMAELASRTSTIAAVLWHQGESDCDESRYPFYEENLTVILDAFRKKLNLHDVPFLLGGIGDFLLNYKIPGAFKNYVHINNALKQVSQKMPMTGFVSAEGLDSNPDNLHFSAKSLREFGIRYYNEFVKIEDKNKIFVEKTVKDATRAELEGL